MSAKNQLQVAKEQTIENVQNRIAQLQEGGFKLPKNYSPENALQSAWLILQDVKTRDNKPVLEACSKNSIAMSLFKMVQLGLNPAKNQCYFVPYGKDLVCMTSYFGQVLIGKRAGLLDVKAEVIRDGEDFDYQTETDGRKILLKHAQSFKTLSNNILGAYCIITYPDGAQDMDIMTIAEIKQSWQQGATKGTSPAHKNFEAEMAKRTVTNRAIKMFVNSSDDSAILDDYDVPNTSPAQAFVEHQIEEHANSEELELEVEDAEVSEEEMSEDEYNKILQEQLEKEQRQEQQQSISGPGF